MIRSHNWRAALVVALASTTAGSCGHAISPLPVENQRPVVHLTHAPATLTGRTHYRYTMQWNGFDPDGEVRHFLFAVDPPSPSLLNAFPETTWTSTQDHHASFEFEAADPDSQFPGGAYSSDFHSFVIRAVDDRGLESLSESRTFRASTAAPTVAIVDPLPAGRARISVPSSIRVTWNGWDPDGIGEKKPAYYRTRLLSFDDVVPPSVAAAFPDTLRHYYAPRGWTGWDSLGPGVTSQRLTDLTPERDYGFCVIAFDEAGAYTPQVSPSTNMLYFRSLLAQQAGPTITLYNGAFHYTYPGPSYRPADPTQEIYLEVPANIPFELHWSAEPYLGTTIAYYRWVLDPSAIDDETPRTNERTDVRHWSQRSALVTQLVLPPFGDTGEHHLYVEAGDNNGLRSLGHLRLMAVGPNFGRELLIVDDTRLTVDRRSLSNATSCVDRPLGPWPTAAELDTFLYARGGVPIRCYPAGSVSRPGLFQGYDFDTLNGRSGKLDQTVPLSTLALYRHVLWIVDGGAASNYETGQVVASARTTMRQMNEPGRVNTLSSYLGLGGQVWLAGGGVVWTSLTGRWVPPDPLARSPVAYSYDLGTLIPTTFAHDQIHWRSRVERGVGLIKFRRSLGRLEAAPGPYAALPFALEPKSLAAGDSMPAWRTSPGDFYQTSFLAEALTEPNPVVEDYDPSPAHEDLRSTLDTLYTLSGGSLGSGVAMTVYHGLGNDGVIASGFSLWGFQRTQLARLVDGVLQGIWGMSKRPPPPTPAP